MNTFALDARKIADFGIGTYIRGLARALEQQLGDDQLVLLGDPRSPAVGDAGLERSRWIEERSPLYSRRELRSLPRTARRAGASLLHVPHYTLPFGDLVPTVVTIHDLIHLRFPAHRTPLHRLYARWMIGRAVRSAAAVLTVSSATRDELIERFGAAGERAIAIPNGIDERFFDSPGADDLAPWLARHALPSSYLLFVGNPMPHKNLGRLLEALSGIRTPLDAPEPVLVIAGAREPEASRIAESLRRDSLSERVRLLRHLDSAELPFLYAAASLVIVPSLWEGFGLPAAEAMACGVPVVAARRGGLVEVVGDAGILVDPLSSVEIGSAIEALLRDPSRRHQLAERGRSRAARFRWPATARRTLEVYREVLARGRRDA